MYIQSIYLYIDLSKKKQASSTIARKKLFIADPGKETIARSRTFFFVRGKHKAQRCGGEEEKKKTQFTSQPIAIARQLSARDRRRFFFYRDGNLRALARAARDFLDLDFFQLVAAAAAALR